MTVHHDHRGYRPAPGPSVSDRLSPFWRWLSEVMWRLEHGFERAKADARPEEDTRVRIFLILIVFSCVFGGLAIGASYKALFAPANGLGRGDVVVTAGVLTKASALRKLFEGHKAAVAAPIYDDPPTEDEVAAWLADAGLRAVPPAAMRDLMALSRALDPGDFRQTVEKIGLFKHGDDEPLSGEEIAALAPATIEADVDDLIHAAADGRSADLAPLMVRIGTQGILPVTICIAALRHFRALHTAASDPGGAAAGLSRLRPPVFGPRRDRMARQAQGWGMRPLEDAVRLLLDTDLTLRSSSRAPAMAVMERALIRLAMMPRGQR